jgi:hypothetical protein
VLLFLAGTASFMVGCLMGSRRGRLRILIVEARTVAEGVSVGCLGRSTKESVQEASAGVCWPARRCSKVLDPDV